MCISRYLDVSRSKSLYSLRGNHFFNDFGPESSDFAFSVAKIPYSNKLGPRKIGFIRVWRGLTAGVRS